MPFIFYQKYDILTIGGNMKSLIRNILGIVLLVLLIYIAYGTEIEDCLKKDEKHENVVLNDKEDFKIYYIDVGEADCTLIKNNNEYVLIDAGNNQDGLKLVEYFKSLGITKFKYVIGTHLHEDHIGGMDYIIKNFDIEHYYMPDVTSEYMTFTEVVDSLKEKDIKWEVPEIDSTFNIGEAKFTVLWISKDEEEINDTSIVLKLDFKNTSYLFTGDATKNVELKILEKDIKSDVLKVSHHGSSDASSAQFLKLVEPKYAIISVAKINDYHHPHDITLKKLNELNIKTYRTDKDGTIVVSSDGENYYFETIKTDTNNE